MIGRFSRGMACGALLGALALGGCGGDDGPNLEPFLGAWKYTSGTSVAMCGNQQSTQQLSQTFNVNKGLDAPLVIIEDTCTWKLDVSGSTASYRAGQSCMVVSQGTSATVIINAGSLTVAGLNATVNGSGTVTVVAQGATIPCTFTLNGTAMKQSR